MDTKLATKQIRLREWAGIIQDCCESGMRVDDYCDQHGITHHQYYYWLRKVKEELITTQAPQLVELKKPVANPEINTFKRSTPTDYFYPQMTISVGNLSIGINENTPMSLLTKVMECVSNA